jgi:hypothetical protein
MTIYASGMGESQMKIKPFTVAALILCLGGSAVTAQTNEQIKQAVGEVAGELEQCSVYFLLLSTCVAKQDPALSLSYRKAADKVGELSLSTGRTAGVSNDAYAALGSMLSDDMMKSMGGNCVNIAVPMKKYMNFCQKLSQDADPRLMEWIKCIQKSDKICNSP